MKDIVWILVAKFKKSSTKKSAAFSVSEKRQEDSLGSLNNHRRRLVVQKNP